MYLSTSDETYLMPKLYLNSGSLARAGKAAILISGIENYGVAKP